MAIAKLPTAVPKEVGPLAWAILAAEKNEKARTPGLTVHVAENGGRMVVATDIHRFHMAAVPDMTPLPPGVYLPPGWNGNPDWRPIGTAWEVDWAAIREATLSWPKLHAGHVSRVDQLYGWCRAAIGYGQSTEWETPVIWLRNRAFGARSVADAIAGGYGNLDGLDLEIAQDREGQHLLRVRHVCGDALTMGVGADVVKAAREMKRPTFDASDDVTWEGVKSAPRQPEEPEGEDRPKLQMMTLEAGEVPFDGETEPEDEPETEQLPGAEWAGGPSEPA